MMQLDPTKSLGDLVAEHPQLATAFDRLRLDYCCGGGRTLEEACRERELTLDDVTAATHEVVDATEEPPVDLRTLPLDALCDHIEATHHTFLRRELPRLAELWKTVVNAHGERMPWTIEVRDVLRALDEELMQHLMKEEMVLFPMIRGLARGDAGGSSHCGGTVRNPISMMELEHDDAGEALAKLRTLTSGYQPPDDACSTLRAALAGLEELERDLHRHIHAENNVLHGAALRAERELRQG